MVSRTASDASDLRLGQIRAEAISAIEGQILTSEQSSRLKEWATAGLSPTQQRDEIKRLYQQASASK